METDEKEETHQLCYRRTDSVSRGPGATEMVDLGRDLGACPEDLLMAVQDMRGSRRRCHGSLGLVVMLESQNVRARQK